MGKHQEEVLEETSDELPEEDGKKSRKKEVILVGAIAVVIPLLAYVAFQFLFSFKESDLGSKESGDTVLEKQKMERRTIVRGRWVAEAIPGLPTVPGKLVEVGSSGGGDVGASGKKNDGEVKVAEGDGERTPGGDIVYTLGEKKWIGLAGAEEGVVVIDRVRVEMDDYGKRVVRGRIANQGIRSLSWVQLSVDFSDAHGGIVQTRLVNPLVISGGLFGDRIQTLQPGGSRTFQVDATDVSSAWSGTVATKIQFHHYLP